MMSSRISSMMLVYYIRYDIRSDIGYDVRILYQAWYQVGYRVRYTHGKQVGLESLSWEMFCQCRAQSRLELCLHQLWVTPLAIEKRQSRNALQIVCCHAGPCTRETQSADALPGAYLHKFAQDFLHRALEQLNGHVNNPNVTSVDGGLQSLQHVSINFICIERWSLW